MKKLFTIMLGLAFLAGTCAYAAPAKGKEQKKGHKGGKKTKTGQKGGNHAPK